MQKPSNREKLLSEGLRVVHQNGFGASGVRDIVHAAGVPQGSFTNHFASKEAFGLEIIDLYHVRDCEQINSTLRNDAMRPLERLRRWLNGQLDTLRAADMRTGCLYGNFSAEASEQSEAIRERIVSIFQGCQDSVDYCLQAAVKAGELSAGTDTNELAGFIISSMQGAILVAKARRSPEPVERFVRVLFDHVLPARMN
jgi:TetR/AcrR family transcriptional repressor of nem operon